MFICVMCASPVNKRLEEPNMLHPFISASNIHGTRLRQEGGARSRVIYILKMSDPTLCRSLCLLMLVIALMAAPPLGSTQAHDEPYIVKPTPILRATGADGYNKRHVKHYTTHSTKSESTDTMSRLQNIRMLADTNHLLVGVNFDDMSDRSLDEARFNLATHVMSNGVELIIASDKVKHVDTVHGFDTVSSSRQVQLKPVTLAPSTLKNHMILALPTSRQENFTIPTDENQFITKTCLTTYTYHTTYLNKGSTTVESREKVVSNRHTEERNFLRASTQLPLGVTLSNTLELAVGIFPTTYHYYNTLKGNDLVITSSYTVINTVTGPEDYISYLQPSEDATPMLDTNTYYTPLVITKTIQDGSESTKVVTDENILTQIVVTESIPARGAARLHPSIYALSDNKFDPTSSIDVQIYATKTYLTTVSYLATATHPSSKEENDNLSSFQTKVIVNVMTDIVPGSLLGPELLSKFSTELMQKKAKNNRKVLVTLATLLSGETLQVTAVNMLKDGLTAMSVSQVQGFVDKSSSASPDNIRQKTKLAIKTSTIQSNIRIEKTKNQSELDLQHDSDTEDQNPSESENNDIYLRPPSSPTVEQLIGSLNLQRFRPVFDVMAELLQKKIVNKPTQAKPNSINVNDRKNQTNNIISSQSQLDEKPVYIPLKPANSQAERSPSPNTLASFNSDINSSNNKLEINLSRLAAHSLHINPPEAETELDFPDALVDNIWKNNNINNNITPKPNLLLGYQNLLLNNGIPIRPGEIINANADVIIGRPNGIGAQFSASHVDESASAYREKTAINYNVPPFKKKTWVPPPPQIPLSLTPPRLHPLVHERPKINRNQQRVIGDGYSNILRPPAQVSQIYPEFSTTSSIYHFQSPPASHNRFPALYNNPIASNNGNGIYGSQQVIINLNSELNNNEILEIKQIPQIFSTQLASVTTYSMSETNYYRQMPPKISIAPTYSAHHHINLKTDVLSHNVNMNVPPLTFKRENENFPLATAVRGHIPPPNMPLIKIPLNKAHVEVRLTPQNNRLAVEPLDPPEPDRIAGPNIKQTASAFKQRNQNFSKNIESLSKHDPNTSYSSKTISSKKPLNSVFSNPKILASSPQFNSAITNKLANHTSKWNISETRIMWNDPFTSGATDSDQAATNLISSEIKKRPNLVYLRPTLVGEAPINVIDKSSEDQSAEYTTYNSKYNLSNETLSPTADTQSPNVNPNFLGSKPEISLQSSSSKNIAPAKSTVNSWLSLHTPYSNQSVRSKNIASDKSTVDPLLSVHTPDSSQSLRLDKPFVKHKPPTQSKVKSDIPKMIFVAHGERFNLRPIATSQIIENSDLYAGKPTKIYPKFGATSLMPLRLATYLKTTTSTRIYGSQTVVGLQPPPTPPPPSPTRAKETSNRYSTPSTIRHMKSTEIVSHSFQTQFNSGIKVITPSPESPIIKNSVRFEDNRTQELSIWPKSSSISRSNVPESSNVSASNTIRKSSIKKSSTDSKLISISSRKPLLVPTSTHYSNENIRNTSGYLTYNNSQSSLHLLESSEAAPATERQIPIVEIYSNGIPKADKDQITDMLDDATLTKRQNVIFKSIEPSSTTMKKITLTSKTSPALMDEAKLIQRVTKNRTTDSIQAKSRPYTTIMPTTTTMKMQPDISSILVVMTKATGNQSSNSIDLEVPLDYDSSISFEIPARDEEILPPINANSVLLGGILIATPSKTQYTQYTNLNSSDACNPACKSNKNEICTNISEYVNRCKCRLGFARMFPDRPCKPTYTYEMQIPITRVGNYLLKFSDEFLNNSSSQYRHLSSIILDAIDRMVMQSDFRDVYYGVQSKEIYSNRDGAVLGCFLLQLSENSNEKRLETVFKKYLRQSNYSIGGTELYTSKEDINMLSIEDFDECAHDEFNDCSTHAHCFNLVGSYTCSCLDGYVDTSDNSIYPGRQCSDHIVGCDKCNYHGNCVTPTLNRTPVCECFAWHAGAMCQLNLKILLISLIAIGTVFIVLLVCVLLIYTRRRVRVGSTSRPIFITASNYHPSMLTTSSNKSGMSSATLIRKCGSMEKHVILNDSNSESSHNSGPYSFKESNLCAADTVEPEQSDRSLTVMIPRAKYYHPTVLPLKQHELTLEKVDKTILFKGTPHFYDGKLKGTAADASEPFGKEYTAQNSGALVSAGFEVSAIVSDRAVQSSQTVEWKENGNDQTHQKISRANLEAILNSGEDIHRMSSWMSNIPTNTISADLRSFDETTVQAVTKSMHLCFDKVEQSITNEEANTMTERDLGSTFLLPHTHLYKPEKISKPNRIKEMITAAKKMKGSDGKTGGLRHLAGASEVDESDEERELTNLNWLLRNQNLSWPKTIDVNSEDDVNGQVGSNRSLSTAAAEGVNAQKKPKALEYDTLKHMANKSCPDIKKSSTATAPLKRPSPAERYDIFINKIKRDLVEYEKSANKYKTDVTHKPPFNYSHIIGMAMLENGRVTLQQICTWIEAKFAFFRVRKKWNNSIRHNLSLHHCFRNLKREEKGKGGYWELGVDPKKCDRKRIRNRKTTQSKLNPASDLSKNQSPLSKYQFADNAIRSHMTQDSHTPDEKPKNSRLDSSDNNMAEQDMQLDCLTLTEVEVGLGLTLPNVLSPRAHDPDATFLYPDTFAATLTTNNEAFHLQQQYELGTIIISTTGILEEPSCLNSLISNKFGCSNMIYTEDEIPTTSKNVIISSHKMDANKDANVALIASPEMPIPGSFTINCDYSNFRPFMDSVDEPYGYLQSSEINRNEDILDNLLDVCVRDY